jgi:hypothetical protein
VENTYYYTGRIDISDIHPRYSFYQNDLAIRNTADVTSGKSILSNNPRVLFLSRAVYENKPKTAILETIKERSSVSQTAPIRFDQKHMLVYAIYIIIIKILATRSGFPRAYC